MPLLGQRVCGGRLARRGKGDEVPLRGLPGLLPDGLLVAKHLRPRRVGYRVARRILRNKVPAVGAEE
eukprot:9927902-Lingulodinium_polyedra.AAC.1